MKARIMMSMLVIALAAAMIGGATMSYFTATGETNKETYAAGTVIIDVDEIVTIDVAEELLENMAPGDEIKGSFAVENSGTLDLWFRVTPEISGDLFQVLEDDVNCATVEVDIDEPVHLQVGANPYPVDFTVTFPWEAGDAYQGKRGSIKFLVEAEQYRNNENPFVH